MKTIDLFRRVIFMAVVALMTCLVSAQEKGDMAAGLNLSYGTKSGFSNFGIGAKFQYNITDAIRIEPSATYFFKKDYVSMWDLNANVHYLFHVADKFVVYPLAGVVLLGAKADLGDFFSNGGSSNSASETKLGFNLGGGAQYWLSDSFGLNLDIKYQIVSNFDRPVFSLGAVFKF